MTDHDFAIRDERDRLREYVRLLESQNEDMEQRIVLLTIQIQDLQRQVSDALKRHSA